MTWQTYETYQETTLLIQAEISLIGFAYKSVVRYLAEEGKIYVLSHSTVNHLITGRRTTC